MPTTEAVIDQSIGATGKSEGDAARRRAARAAGSPLFRVFYYAYERRLLRRLRRDELPRHIAIILDGNRRYARALGITDPAEIYSIGAGKLDEVIDWCCEIAIPTVTLWVFSPDNLTRSTAEVSGIFAALEAKLAAWAQDPRTHRRRVRLRAIGRLNLLPQSALDTIRAAEAATAHYAGMTLNIAVAYSGRTEIVDAVGGLLRDAAAQGKPIAELIDDLDPDTIARYLYTAGSPDPDLIIRTSGEVRLSGFMLWQCAHSEFYFTDVHWPAFRKVDFLRAVRAYQQRQRRFGR
jgi:short-chain Z-isoprenyl diphosphate synthase